VSLLELGFLQLAPNGYDTPLTQKVTVQLFNGVLNQSQWSAEWVTLRHMMLQNCTQSHRICGLHGLVMDYSLATFHDASNFQQSWRPQTTNECTH
jgi:hypothetical protein